MRNTSNLVNKRYLVATPNVSNFEPQITSAQTIVHESILPSTTTTAASMELDPECIKYCYSTLEKVSRSFAMVIQQLPENIRDSICIFYLILRGLDSIEDDMQNFKK